ncbi:MAG: hypothetical protein LBV47_00785 [Bacteroidales bacterium]|jgi:hypothetical protein|nr:hypothetical protein [Bacteroidales bacterium]
MNRLKLALHVLFLALMTTSCDKEPVFHVYSLALSFRDTLGNDLIKCIEPEYCDNGKPYGSIVNQDVIKQRIRWGRHYKTVYGARINKVSGFYYLDVKVALDDSDINELGGIMPEKVFFEITSMHIFGDYVPCEIITYWETGGKKNEIEGDIYHKCSHIELKGKEFPIENEQFAFSPVVIILDR